MEVYTAHVQHLSVFLMFPFLYIKFKFLVLLCKMKNGMKKVITWTWSIYNVFRSAQDLDHLNCGLGYLKQ